MDTNRLIHETSPYLLQHAHNPVDWYAWGDEAFQKAKSENKPILLSVGYSACHWCHVMERESFEDQKIAALMNELFVSIKVDREERPDIDEVYMNAVQMLTGRGGWPMTVFLTPEGKPFYGGTYFPPEDRYGVPGFPRVLRAVADAYQQKPQDIERSVEQILGGLNRLGALRPSDRPFARDLLPKAAAQLAQGYDSDHGGFGGAPKFPNASVFEVLLRDYRRSKDERVLEMVAHTLTKMAEGGIYDHLGGGFHRYSVDAKWLVPHFEKMLYDNAQLLRIYVDAFRITGNSLFKGVVEQTVDYLLREMLHGEGGFYSTQDADSEGEEGKFFIWTPAEVAAVIGEEKAEIFARVYDVSDLGNFEGKSILHPILTVEQAARYFSTSVDDIEKLISDAQAKLFQEREKRVKPFRDEKILASWNGLALSGLAAAYEITGTEGYRTAAQQTVEFIFSRMFAGGFLLHSYKDGQARLKGFLDDYAFLIVGLLDFYEATLDRSLLRRAEQLAEIMIREFWDEDGGAFFFAGESSEALITRTKPAFDGSVPSGNSMAALGLLRLYHYAAKEDYLKKAEKTLRVYYDALEQQPFGFAQMLSALDFYLEKPKEIVLVGDRREPRMQDLLSKIRLLYLPNQTLQVFAPGDGLKQASPLLEGKGQLNGKPTVYVCHDFTCSLPMTEWDTLKQALET
ncbi:MAG: thioredoxin domain-containing protein [Candidatus Binatia bacterium]